MLHPLADAKIDLDDVCSTELGKSLHGKQNKALLAGLNTSHLLKLISPFGCLNFSTDVGIFLSVMSLGNCSGCGRWPFRIISSSSCVVGAAGDLDLELLVKLLETLFYLASGHAESVRWGPVCSFSSPELSFSVSVRFLTPTSNNVGAPVLVSSLSSFSCRF